MLVIAAGIHGVIVRDEHANERPPAEPLEVTPDYCDMHQGSYGDQIPSLSQVQPRWSGARVDPG